MHHEIDYSGDNSPRRALLDLVAWYGLAKSKLIIRGAKYAATIANEKERNLYYNRLSFAIEMSGVSGKPVRALFEHYGGAEQLASWLASPD